MKKIMAFAAAALAACAVSAGGNLLINGSFELQQERKELPENWGTVNSTGGAKMYQEKGIVLDGKTALRTDTPAGAKGGVTHWIQQNLGERLKAVPDGTEVELAAYVYPVEKSCTVRIFFESSSGKFTKEKYFRGLSPNRWHRIAFRFALSARDYGKSHVCLTLVDSGSAVFDCAYFGIPAENPYHFEADGSPADGSNLLGNASFEVLDAKSMPDGWGRINNAKNSRQSVETKTVLEGKNAVRTDNPDPADAKKIIHWIRRDLKDKLARVKPGTRMELSVYARPVEKPCGVRIFFESPSARFSSEKRFPNLKPDAWHQLKLNFTLPAGDYKSSHVCIQLLGNGSAIFDCAYLGEAGKNDLFFDENGKRLSAPAKTPAELAAGDYCRMMEQNAGSRFRSGKAPKTATLEVVAPAPALDVTLSEIDGGVLKTWHFDQLPVRKKSTVKIDLPELPDSAYELKYVSGTLTDYDWFRVSDPPARGAWFDDDGFPVADGKKFFPVAISVPPMNPDALRVYEASGMNMIFSQAPLNEHYYEYMSELAAKFHIYWFSWNSWGFSQRSGATLRKQFLQRREFLRRHGRFLGFLSDEAMWNGISLDSMRTTYKYAMRYLPEYISYLNHAPRLTGAAGENRHSPESGRRYTRAADLASVDIYPFPEGHGHNNLENRTLSCVGEYADLCRAFTWNTRPVWMIIQAGGWSEEGDRPLNAAQPRPGKKEMRFMAWNAITHGAKGIVWYGRGCKDVYSEWWLQLADVSLELAAMGKLLIAGPITYMTGLPPQVSGISGKGYAVYVNERKTPVTFNGMTLGPQEVKIITDQPLQIPRVSRFSRQEVKLSKDYGFDKEVILNAFWVCHPQYGSGTRRTVYAKRNFTIPAPAKEVKLMMSVDDEAIIRINGKEVGSADSFRMIQQFDITKFTRSGENLLELEILNAAGPTAVVFEIVADGKTCAASDKGTLHSLTARDAADFVPAREISRHPKGTWGKPVMVQKMPVHSAE